MEQILWTVFARKNNFFFTMMQAEKTINVAKPLFSGRTPTNSLIETIIFIFFTAPPPPRQDYYYFFFGW